MEAFKRLMIVVVVFFGLVLTLAALTTPDDVRSTPPSGGSAIAPSYSHEDLQADATMTQDMSAPDATGPMHRDDQPNQMLGRSQNPGYLQALERHQRGLDQMLARPSR